MVITTVMCVCVAVHSKYVTYLANNLLDDIKTHNINKETL